MPDVSFDDLIPKAKAPAPTAIGFDDLIPKQQASAHFDDLIPPSSGHVIVPPGVAPGPAKEPPTGLAKYGEEFMDRSVRPAMGDIKDLGSRLYSGLHDPREDISRDYVASRDLLNSGAHDIWENPNRLLTNQGLFDVAKMGAGFAGAVASPITGSVEALVNSPVEKVDPNLAEGMRRGEAVAPLPGLEGTSEVKGFGKGGVVKELNKSAKEALDVDKVGEDAVAKALAEPKPAANEAMQISDSLRKPPEPTTGFDDLIPKEVVTDKWDTRRTDGSLQPVRQGDMSWALKLPPYKTGTPTVVDGFHGTNQVFNEFDPGMLKEGTGAKSAGEGFFFSRNPETANQYTGDINDPWFANNFMEKGRLPNTHVASLEFKNPLVHDYKGEDFKDKTYADVIAKAKADGHDGAILLNTKDGGPLDVVYVAFDKDQIRPKYSEKQPPAEPPKPPVDLPPPPKSPEPPAPPASASINARDAQALIRQRIGLGERDSAQTAAALEPFQAKVNALSPEQKLGFMDYIENRSKGMKLEDPSLQPVADTLRDAFEYRERKIAAMPKTDNMSFVEDYFPHMWKDPRKAEQFVQQWGTGKQGSGANLKKRSIPTIADGIAAGLELKTTNPLEAATMYTANMDRYIAMREVIDTAKEQGAVKYVTPGQQPEGWVQLNGRAGENGALKGYAPADWARNYNNFISRGWGEIDPAVGKFVDQARKVSNFTTMLELSLSGYHLLTMAQEGVANEFARSIGEAASLRPDKAALSVVKAPIAPVSLALKGAKAQSVYLGLKEGTPLEKELVHLLSQANARMTGMDKTLRQTAAGSYWTAWKRGALGNQLREEAAGIKGPKTAVSAIANNIARASETIQAPLFEHYIPMVKNGAAMENLKSWLELHPNATEADKVTAARQIWDSIDNRFGEMVQDNIFWNQALKQSAQLMMRSYSWNLGTMREIGGGIKDLATGKMGSERAKYVFALPLAYAYTAAVYQYLKTGQAPQDMHDLLAPRTGGVDAATGKPERVMMPGYMKDVVGWTENGPVNEAYSKMATLPRAGYELLANKDWKGQPIREQDPNKWLQNYFDYVTDTFGPMSLRQAAEGRKRGSNISGPEGFMGMRPAPRYMTDPAGYDAMMKKLGATADKKKERSDMRQKALMEK